MLNTNPPHFDGLGWSAPVLLTFIEPPGVAWAIARYDGDSGIWYADNGDEIEGAIGWLAIPDHDGSVPPQSVFDIFAK